MSKKGDERTQIRIIVAREFGYNRRNVSYGTNPENDNELAFNISMTYAYKDGTHKHVLNDVEVYEFGEYENKERRYFIDFDYDLQTRTMDYEIKKPNKKMIEEDLIRKKIYGEMEANRKYKLSRKRHDDYQNTKEEEQTPCL